MTQVWENGPEAHGELLVLLALADFADDEGNCWPSMRRIAEKARMTERGAQKVVRKLEAGGYLKTVIGGGRHGCNQYQITPNVVRPEHGSPRTREHKNPEHGDIKPRTGVHPNRHRTIKEPSVSIARETLRAVAGEEAVDGFIAHRKALKKPLTDRAAQIIAKKLEHHPDPDAVLDESVANGWQGVFPDRVFGRPKPVKSASEIWAEIEREEHEA